MLQKETSGTGTSLQRIPSNPGRTADSPARAVLSVDALKNCAGSSAAQPMRDQLTSPVLTLLEYLFTPSFFQDVWEKAPLVLPHSVLPRNPFVAHRWIAEEDIVCMSYRAAVAGTLKIFRQGVALPPPSMPTRSPLLHRSRARSETASWSRHSRLIEDEAEGICGSEDSVDARGDDDTCANTSRLPSCPRFVSAGKGACLLSPGRKMPSSLSYTTADSLQPESSSLLACVGPYLDGCSLVINQADRTHPGLQELCRALGQRLFTHVFAVAYLTPPSSYAVGTHTDDQDVFLIQLWGQKHWKLYAPPQQLPLSEEMLGKKEPFSKDPGQPVLQRTLEEGDILYIPRGFPHKATTTTQNSLHITITVPTAEYAYISALNRFLKSVVLEHKLGSETEQFCRAALILKTNNGGPPCSKILDRMKKATEELTSHINYKAVADVLQKHLDEINAAQTAQFERLQAIPVQPIITHLSLVRLAPGIRCTCEEGSAEALFFRSGQRSASYLFETLLGIFFLIKSALTLAKKKSCE